MDIETLAVTAGLSRWLHAELFSILGSWSVDSPEPAVREYFGVQCQRHAWHGELWTQRQPDRPGVPADAYVVAPSPGIAASVAALRDATNTAERLAGYARVALPRMATVARTWLTQVDAAVDAPTARVITLVLRDELEAWAEGEHLLQNLLTADSAPGVHAHVARLETLLFA